MRTLIEIQTPPAHRAHDYIEKIERLDNVTGVVLEEAGGVSVPAFASMLKEKSDKDIFLKLSCRDRNRIALRSELATCAALELSNVILVDGPHPIRTPFPEAKPVYDLDSLSLLQMIRRGLSDTNDGDSFLAESGLAWTIAACIGGSTEADLARARRFSDAGLDIFFVLSVEAVEPLRNLTDKPIIISFAAEDSANMSDLLARAESVGADGANLVVENPAKVIDGSIA